MTAPSSTGASAGARGTLLRVGTLVGLLVAWEVATRSIGHPFFPPPSQIATTLVTNWLSPSPTRLFLSDLAIGHIGPSLARMLGGWAIAAVLGVAVGVALGRSRTALELTEPLLAFARAIPPPALVPVFLVLFTLGTPMQLATIVFGVVWPILLNTVDGVRSVHAVPADTARAFRISRVRTLTGVVLPAAAPKIFAGLRIGLSFALILMVISELVGATNGLGLQLTLAQRRFDFPAMWAVIVLLGVLGYLLNSGLVAVERRVLRWQPRRMVS